MPIIPNSTPPKPGSRTPVAVTSPSNPNQRASTVVVTDEQIYRAVSSMMLRGDVRNGNTRAPVVL